MRWWLMGAVTITLGLLVAAPALLAQEISLSDAVPVVDQPPVAQWTAEPTQGPAPLTVKFDASTSYDPDGALAGYDWDFGDDTTHSPDAVVSHTFEAAGQYTVTLTVTDASGQSQQALGTITVQAAPAPPLAVEPAPQPSLTIAPSTLPSSDRALPSLSQPAVAVTVTHPDYDPVHVTPNPLLIPDQDTSVLVQFAQRGEAVATPVFEPTGGSFVGSVQVTIQTTTPGAELRYTLDGSDPSPSTILYSGPFTLPRTALVKARGFKAGLQPSAIASATFIIGDQAPPRRSSSRSGAASPDQ